MDWRSIRGLKIILMTLTTLFSLLSLAFFFGSGSSSRSVRGNRKSGADSTEQSGCSWVEKSGAVQSIELDEFASTKVTEAKEKCVALGSKCTGIVLRITNDERGYYLRDGELSTLSQAENLAAGE